MSRSVSRSPRVVLAALLVAVSLTACSNGGAERESRPSASAGGTGSIAAAPAKSVTSTATSLSEVHGLDLTTSEAKMILDALRVPVQKALGQPVSVDAGFVNEWGTYATVQGIALGLDGREIDYGRIARYSEAVKFGAFDPQLCALLRNDGGQWRVLKWEVGATDAAFVPWSEQFGLPEDIWTLKRY